MKKLKSYDLRTRIFSSLRSELTILKYFAVCEINKCNIWTSRFDFPSGNSLNLDDIPTYWSTSGLSMLSSGNLKPETTGTDIFGVSNLQSLLHSPDYPRFAVGAAGRFFCGLRTRPADRLEEELARSTFTADTGTFSFLLLVVWCFIQAFISDMMTEAFKSLLRRNLLVGFATQ